MQPKKISKEEWAFYNAALKMGIKNVGVRPEGIITKKGLMPWSVIKKVLRD